MGNLWIVTREINQYDQDGEYFVAAFDHKPDFKELQILLPDQSDVTIGKLTRGGGRQNSEDEWFLLFEVKSGQTDW